MCKKAITMGAKVCLKPQLYMCALKLLLATCGQAIFPRKPRGADVEAFPTSMLCWRYRKLGVYEVPLVLKLAKMA